MLGKEKIKYLHLFEFEFDEKDSDYMIIKKHLLKFGEPKVNFNDVNERIMAKAIDSKGIKNDIIKNIFIDGFDLDYGEFLYIGL